MKIYKKTDYKRRVHKLFATANIKIGSVVSDLFGKTGQNLIGQPSAQQIVGIDHVNETTIPQG